jgi:hypothetical protein
MNSAPHKHTISLTETTACVYVAYGDTGITINKRFHRFPSQRRLTKAARKAVLQHDSGSQQVQALDRAQDALRSEVRSDWYMDSEQRMEDLHKEAITEDRWRNTETWTVDFSVDTGGIKGELARLAFVDEMRQIAYSRRLLLSGGS